MPAITNRTLRQRRSVAKALKDLGAKKGSFPVRTGFRRGVYPRVEDVPPPPSRWLGTLPEWAIYWAHNAMQLVEGHDFIYQYQLGHPNDPQSAKLDFMELNLGIGINVQGMHWHYGMGGYKILSDAAQKVRVESLGITLIAIDENMANTSPIYYLREARALRDHSLAASGF